MSLPSPPTPRLECLRSLSSITLSFPLRNIDPPILLWLFWLRVVALAMWPFISSPEYHPQEVHGNTYDYIVVGGGTAGCVLAARLSEEQGATVLLLEKGYVKDTLISRMPLMSQNFFLGDILQVQSTRWSEPMTGANMRKNQLWTTEGIGGASRINAMLWTRGWPADYESWSARGLGDWGWDKVEPYFRRIENTTCHPDSTSRGHGGPVHLRQDRYAFHWTSYLEKAVQRLNVPLLKDCNEPRAPACGYFPLDTAISPSGERVSAFTAYLNQDIMSQRRGRLTVCTGALTTRLELDNQAGVAKGVYFRSVHNSADRARDEYFVSCRREVILCAGAICTSQLLMLSGLGPRTELTNLEIPIVKELPAVGATLSDHYAIPVMLELPRQETLRFLQSLWGLWHIILWILCRIGLMATSSVTGAIFLQTDSLDETTMEHKANKEEEGAVVGAATDQVATAVPDIEIMIIPLNTLERDVPGRSLLSLYPTLLSPLGSGRVELVDRDPASNPRVTHPMYLHEHDVVVARRAVKFVMRLADEFQRSGYPYEATLAFAPGNHPGDLIKWERDGDSKISTNNQASVETTVNRSVPTENKIWANVTDAEIDDYMRRVTHTALHLSCSCPMSNSQEDGVVDQQLRVFGFSNLRLADASVFPRIPRAHTMAPVIMVAERCADFVKETWADQAASGVTV
ncbi:putative GMC oxidoreductase [Nemania sp. FL0916]|nr:putative GMC oxidoreductase [Nemania sp. FL0916]